MLDERDIYNLFRKAQGLFFDRPYRLPKDWSVYYGKMEKKNKQALEVVTKFFNTKWQNLDPQKYFSIGFEIYRNQFTYTKIFDKIILKQYINRDKVEKIEQSSIFNDFEKSVNYVYNTTEGGKASRLLTYANKRSGLQCMAVCDYLKNNIGRFFLIYLITRKLIEITSEEMMRLPYVTNDYESSIIRLERIENNKDFKKILRKIS